MRKPKPAVRLLSWGKALRLVLLVYGGGILLGFGILFWLSRDLPSIEQLQNIDPELVSRVYSRDGQVLHEFYTQRRIYKTLDQMPSEMLWAVISIEDSRFFRHWGVSTRDFLRAMITDVITLSKAQGASTLTQQVARILYESIGFEKTLIRKAKELLTAIQIERMYAKGEIAELYLNVSYWGGVYGVQAASRRYFNKDVENLTIEECALIAGMIQHSVRYSPFRNPINAFQRRNLVLYRMYGLGYISREAYALARNTPLQVQRQEQPPRIAPYFVEYVRQQLMNEDENLGIDLYRDGLSIYTTLDSRLQTIADSALQRHLRYQQNILNNRLLSNRSALNNILTDSTFNIDQVRAMIRGDVPLDSLMRYSLLVQGAFIALDPSTGWILAMIGGRNFEESEFNRAVQSRRLPGSVFKPIAYATAIDNGFPVTQQLLNQPVVVEMPDGTRWTPHNYDFSTGGLTTLRDALRESYNLVAARVVQELISPNSVVETARNMHITTRVPAVDAIALGTASVIPLEITSAYAIFCNHGVWVEPVAITRIEDRHGNVIKEYVPRQDIVFSEETAYLVTDMMETVMNTGTGKNARRVYGFNYHAAGKTGTTDDFTDAWFAGFTPYIVSCVWVGVDNPAVTLGSGQSGAMAALPIWANFMREAHQVMHWKDKPFVRPPGIVEVEICKESKLLPSQYCPVETEIFSRETVPTEHCPLHQSVNQNGSRDRVVF
jgi:penicillin-binding protein 1A